MEGLIYLAYLIFIAWLLLRISSERSRLKSRKLRLFLEQNERKEFFCYTNKKEYSDFIEEFILPKLDESISIIQLKGKQPVSEFDESIVSELLYSLPDRGLPSVVKIVNGHATSKSFKNELYSFINQGSEVNAIDLIQVKLDEIRGKYSGET